MNNVNFQPTPRYTVYFILSFTHFFRQLFSLESSKTFAKKKKKIWSKKKYVRRKLLVEKSLKFQTLKIKSLINEKIENNQKIVLHV